MLCYVMLCYVMLCYDVRATVGNVATESSQKFNFC